MDELVIDGKRMETLRAICDTYVPSIEHVPDPFGHWSRSASSYGVPEAVAQALSRLPADQHAGFCQLLDVLASQGMLSASQASPEQLLGNITLQAGSCLGGGTVVNWTNSIRTKEWVRREWASQWGLTDVADDFDRHLDAICERLSVSTDCCDLNKPHQAMRRGAEALGWS